MVPWWTLIVAFFVGGTFGLLISALCVAAKDN